jgi:phosphonate degradation associated HDIG domain protein
VRYDGRAKHLPHAGLARLLAEDRVVGYCPEVAGGLPVPRPAAEIVGGDGAAVIDGRARVETRGGEDVTGCFLSGARLALELCQRHAIETAVRTESSPSCGSSRIYDGSFARRPRAGSGVTAALLRRQGIAVFSHEQLDAALRRLEDEGNRARFWPPTADLLEPGSGPEYPGLKCRARAMPRPAREETPIVDAILDLFATRGAREYMGEAVSMSQHMEQTAACARADGATDSLVAAALLHDIGHFVGEHPIEALENGIDNDHETVGAEYLDGYFAPAVTEPIRLHVAAKRYLCATDGGYTARLSPASINSLAVQGGPMTAAEVDAFESSPYHRDAVRLRLYDDDGKVAGLEIRAAREYRGLLESLLLR